MVAYNFMKMFVPQVEGLIKRQTIRADRKRHARPGEAVQLYFAMRTQWCRKLVKPDPICQSVSPIEIEFNGPLHNPISTIAVNEVALQHDDMMELAINDGFDLKRLRPQRGLFDDPGLTPLFLMGVFWVQTHGWNRFSGWLIKWEPAA